LLHAKMTRGGICVGLWEKLNGTVRRKGKPGCQGGETGYINGKGLLKNFL